MEIYAYLGFEGNFNPDDITRYVGVQPSDYSRKGDILRNDTARRFSSWTLSTPEIETYDVENVVRNLIDIIRPYKDKLGEVGLIYSIDAAVVIVVYGLDDPIGEDEARTLGMLLDRDIIEFINDLNAAIVLDSYM